MDALNMSGTNSADTLKFNDLSKNKIFNALGGNDILNIEGGTNNTYNLNSGYNTVNVKKGSGTIVNTGTGKDTINVYNGVVSKIKGTGKTAADSIKITGGSIENIEFGAGADKVVANGGIINSLSLGDGYNTVFVSGSNIDSIQGGNTNDTLTVSAGHVGTIVGTDTRQKLTVKGFGSVGEADLRGGSDVISLEDDAIVGTLKMGSGDNFAYIYKNAQVTDTIYGGTGVDRLRLDSGSIGSIVGGTGVQRLTIDGGTVGNINVGSGDDLVSVTGGTVQNITLDKGSNQVYIYGGHVAGTIAGGTGNDKIKVVSGTVENIAGTTGTISVTLEKDAIVKELNGGSGNDTFVIRNSNQTLNAGAGDDTIYISGNGNYNVAGGTGSDIITINGSCKGTVAGGTGSDTFYVKWNDGMNLTIDNSDFIQGDADKLIITGKTRKDFDYSFDEFHNELTLSEKNGKGSITINLANGRDVKDNFAGITFNETFVSKEDLIPPADPVNAQSVIKTFMRALDASEETGFDALDEAIQWSSHGRFANFTDLVQEFKTACMTLSGSNVTENRQFLWDYCNVDMLNEDTGAISGADAKGLAGTGVEITEEAMVPEPEGMTPADLVYDYSEFSSVTAKDFSIMVTSPEGTVLHEYNYVDKTFYSFEVNGVVFYWNESNWSNLCTKHNIDRSVLEQLVAGVLKAWTDPSMKLIFDSYGMSMSEKRNVCYQIDGKPAMQLFLDYDASSNALASVSYRGNSSGNGVYEIMTINLKYYHDAITDINGNSSNTSHLLDNTIAHEMVHAVMGATIPGYSKLPRFMREGLADLIRGADGIRDSDIINIPDQDKIWHYKTFHKDGDKKIEEHLAYDQETMLDKLFDLDDMQANWGSATYAAGYLLMRYFAKQVDSYVNQYENSAAHDNALYIGQGSVEEAAGGRATIGDVYNNRVYVSNMKLTYVDENRVITETGAADILYGGVTEKGNVYNNTVGIIGKSTAAVGTLYGGFTEEGNIFNNLIRCQKVYNRNCMAYGGYTKNGDVYDNEFSVDGSQLTLTFQANWQKGCSGYDGLNSYYKDIYGGFSELGTVRDNKLMVKNTFFAGKAYGASVSDGLAQDNTLSLTNIYSNYATAAYVEIGNAKQNTVEWAGGYIKELYGAVVDNGDAIRNTVKISASENGSYVVTTMGARLTVNGGAAYENNVIVNKPDDGQLLFADEIYGAYADNSGAILYNTVVLNGGNINNVYGAFSGNGGATGNEVFIQEDTVINNNVYVAVTNGNTSDNLVAVLGHASVHGSVLGSDGSDFIIVGNDSGVGVNGNLGADIFAFDLSVNSGSSILDTDSNNILKLLNTDISSVSIRKNGSSLTIAQDENVLNISNSASISSIDFISGADSSSKWTFDLAGAVSSLTESALGFSDASLSSFLDNDVVLNDQDRKVFIAASGKTE